MAFNSRKKDEERVLDVDASMQGSMVFKEPVNLRINGKFDGTLETKGNLTIGPSALVTADITGDNIIVGGKVKGKISARQRLTLLPTASVEGDIFPARLNIAEGAVLEGRCSMLHDFFNIDEVARYLEVDVKSVSEWAAAGKIPCQKEGEVFRFDRRAVDNWIASGEVAKR
jgi:excisionase family DNA binding protein